MNIDPHPALEEEFLAAIGRLTISWAQLELGLDCAINSIHRGFRGDQIEPEMPRALRRRLRYLRAAFNSIPELVDLRTGFLTLAAAIEDASETRHDIIHGVIRNRVVNGGVFTVEMVRLLRASNAFEQKPFSVTTVDVLKAAVIADNLADQSIDIGLEVATCWLKR